MLGLTLDYVSKTGPWTRPCNKQKIFIRVTTPTGSTLFPYHHTTRSPPPTTTTSLSFSFFHFILAFSYPTNYDNPFADDTFKRIFLDENVRASIRISLKFVLKGPIDNIPALVQIKAWRRSGDKPLSEPMMVNSLTHICVTRPQWVVNLLDWRRLP